MAAIKKKKWNIQKIDS